MSTPKIANLAQLKRHLQVGARLRLVWRNQGGDCEEMREVTKVQGNAVVFRGDVRGELKDGLWLHWPKSKEVTFDEKGFEVVEVKPGGEPQRRLRYEYVADGEPAPPTEHERTVAGLLDANPGWKRAFAAGYARGMKAATTGDDPNAMIWFNPAEHPTDAYLRAAGYRAAFFQYARSRATAWEKARSFHQGQRVEIVGINGPVTLVYVGEHWDDRLGRRIDVEHRRPDDRSVVRSYHMDVVSKSPKDPDGCAYGLKRLPAGYVNHGPFDATNDAERPAQGEVWWCGDKAPPEIGERVAVRMNQFGGGEVTSYFYEHGFLGVELRVDQQPPWHRTQNGHSPYVLVFAIELEGRGSPKPDVMGTHGRCDTCGAPCEENGCTMDRGHEVANPTMEGQCRASQTTSAS